MMSDKMGELLRDISDECDRLACGECHLYDYSNERCVLRDNMFGAIPRDWKFDVKQETKFIYTPIKNTES